MGDYAWPPLCDILDTPLCSSYRLLQTGMIRDKKLGLMFTPARTTPPPPTASTAFFIATNLENPHPRISRWFPWEMRNHTPITQTSFSIILLVWRSSHALCLSGHHRNLRIDTVGTTLTSDIPVDFCVQWGIGAYHLKTICTLFVYHHHGSNNYLCPSD